MFANSKNVHEFKKVQKIKKLPTNLKNDKKFRVVPKF